MAELLGMNPDQVDGIRTTLGSHVAGLEAVVDALGRARLASINPAGYGVATGALVLAPESIAAVTRVIAQLGAAKSQANGLVSDLELQINEQKVTSAAVDATYYWSPATAWLAIGQSLLKDDIYGASKNSLIEQFSQRPDLIEAAAWWYLGFTRGRDGVLRTNPLSAQLLGGYNKAYDAAFNAATEMSAHAYPFVYHGTSYVIWTWKGEYLNMGDGGEIGVYEQAGSHPNMNGQWWAKPLDPSLPKTTESVTDGGSTVASFGAARRTVWNGSYNPDVQDRNVSDLKFTATVTFPNAEMYKAFEHSGSLSQPGATVKFNDPQNLTATISG